MGGLWEEAPISPCKSWEEGFEGSRVEKCGYFMQQE